MKALCTETVIVCRDLDEITSEEELMSAQKTQCIPGEGQMTIQLRKVNGGTQTATIHLAVTAANKAQGVGKVTAGWSKCPFTVAPPANRLVEGQTDTKCAGAKMAFGNKK